MVSNIVKADSTVYVQISKVCVQISKIYVYDPKNLQCFTRCDKK